EAREESGTVPADQRGQAEGAPRRAGVPRRGDRAAHPAVRRPARNGAAVAGFAPCERSGGAKARVAREVIGRSLSSLPGCVHIEDNHDSGRQAIVGLSAQFGEQGRRTPPTRNGSRSSRPDGPCPGSGRYTAKRASVVVTDTEPDRAWTGC